jgi:glycerol-3-phosphate dehydrogenase
MKRLETEVLVIGGGATGAGVARDAAMRGFDTILLDRADLAMGTTGRFHGLLHSGGRYVVKDPPSAAECMSENLILKRIAADAIEDTGGLFVTTPWDDPDYAGEFHDGCLEAGIPVEVLSAAEILRREPRLNPHISGGFSVPDAAVDAWKTVWGCARSARAHGAKVLTYHPITKLTRRDGRVTGAVARDEADGQDVVIDAGFVINATGVWAGTVAEMGGCEGVTVIPGKGIMIAMNHRLVNTVVNRCKKPADGDILVPIRTVSVIGTTDEHVEDPDANLITQAEVELTLDEGEKLVPGFRQARALRAWAGSRPLFKDDRARGESSGNSPDTSAETREMSRSFALLDHRERDGIEGFLTITGGKFTTFRRMAEITVDKMCEQMGEARACRTAEEMLPDSEDRRYYWLGERLARREANLTDDQLICECELISRRRLETAMERRRTTNLDDIRRTLRLAMGPCQGGFCIYRATGILYSVEHLDGIAANGSLRRFLEERWKGVHPILYGDQLRQARLDDWIFHGLLDVDHLPDPGRAQGSEVVAPATAT